VNRVWLVLTSAVFLLLLAISPWAIAMRAFGGKGVLVTVWGTVDLYGRAKVLPDVSWLGYFTVFWVALALVAAVAAFLPQARTRARIYFVLGLVGVAVFALEAYLFYHAVWAVNDAALAEGGVFCFNAVDKQRIDNASFVSHSVCQADGRFRFSSGWHYRGEGEQQLLRLRIERQLGEQREVWDDEHPMVAVSFAELQALLAPYFEVQVLEHDYQRLLPWDGHAGNALFACSKR